MVRFVASSFPRFPHGGVGRRVKDYSWTIMYGRCNSVCCFVVCLLGLYFVLKYDATASLIGANITSFHFLTLLAPSSIGCNYSLRYTWGGEEILICKNDIAARLAAAGWPDNKVEAPRE